ncbi:hypothetical protein [Dethiosulfovibrio salsuginis]|uniref:Uncharacterized protein n=1 Tax=Dethiosulfovibrio salsuginis TaxID=561720 RepID=A0A1X7JJA0_9BACT|nr:hypothetical protein [Dethiosulfovibrio salsuginis]SMG27838.1 hypothetical protein SAMN06275492_11273 [Dethiosulfovibrio salsuginis]
MQINSLDGVMETLRTLLIDQIAGNVDRMYQDEETMFDPPEWKVPVNVTIGDHRLVVETVFETNFDEDDLEDGLEDDFTFAVDKALRFYIDSHDVLPLCRYTRLSKGAGLTEDDFVAELGSGRYFDIVYGRRDLDKEEYAKMLSVVKRKAIVGEARGEE